jgi:S1/P1 Nuclease
MLAWNKAGHMVTGAIAYRDLKQSSPGTIQKTIALLKKHPEYSTRWKPILDKANLSDEDQNLYLFMLAARWPDDARGSTFDRPKWHYVNFSLTPGAATGPLTPLDPENILTAYKQNLNGINSTAAVADKAVALCWLFHLSGDVHQPLHTTALVNQQFPLPEGDRGGTRFYIKVKPTSATISLHKFWDDLIQGSEMFQSVRNKAIQINGAFKRSDLPELSNTNFEGWAKKETYILSEKQAYLNGKLKGSSDKTNGEVLPTNYTASAKAVAERQVAIASYRLSNTLKKNAGFL